MLEVFTGGKCGYVTSLNFKMLVNIVVFIGVRKALGNVASEPRSVAEFSRQKHSPFFLIEGSCVANIDLHDLHDLLLVVGIGKLERIPTAGSHFNFEQV